MRKIQPNKSYFPFPRVSASIPCSTTFNFSFSYYPNLWTWKFITEKNHLFRNSSLIALFLSMPALQLRAHSNKILVAFSADSFFIEICEDKCRVNSTRFHSYLDDWIHHNRQYPEHLAEQHPHWQWKIVNRILSDWCHVLELLSAIRGLAISVKKATNHETCTHFWCKENRCIP